MLQFEYYNTNHYGSLSLFTNMERIKLAYLNLQKFIKIENLYEINGQRAYSLGQGE